MNTMEEIFNKYCNEVIPYYFDDKKNETKELFSPIINEILNNHISQDKPTFIHMLGIPGAGKTTYMNNNKECFKDFLFLDFDMVMERLPEYREDVKKLGSVEAFEKWEIPSRIAGYEVLLQAIKKSTYFIKKDNDCSLPIQCKKSTKSNILRTGGQQCGNLRKREQHPLRGGIIGGNKNEQRK